MEDPDTMRTHPAEVDLVAFADGELDTIMETGVARHVGACRRCQDALNALGPPIETTPSVDNGVLLEGEPDLRLLFTGVATDDPVPGELWRLEWEGTGLLAMVLAEDGPDLLVAPVTFERPDEPVAVEVPAEDTPTGTSMFVWHRLAQPVPLGAFLAPVAALPVQYMEKRPEATAFGPNTVLLMADVSAALAHVAAVPELQPETAASVDLRTLLSGHATSALASATEIPMAVIQTFKRNLGRPNHEEAHRLAAFLGTPTANVLGSVRIPEALARVVQRPLHRIAIRLRAAAASVSEAVMRVTVAEAVMVTPARTTGGERDEEAWDELIRQYLDE